MKLQLIFWLAVCLSAGLFGCATPPASNSQSADLNEPVFDPSTGLPMGKPRPVLSRAEEKELRGKLVTLAKAIHRTIHSGRYDGFWEDDPQIRSGKDLPFGLNCEGLVSEFYYSYFRGTYSGTRVVNFEQGNCGIQVRAYRANNNERLQLTWPGSNFPESQMIFRQALFGRRIVIEVNMATDDEAFMEQLRKALAQAAGS